MAMIAVLRPDSTSAPVIAAALRALGHSVVDVTEVEQISVARVTSDGDVDMALRAKPFAAFEHVMFLGAPKSKASPGDHFRESEMFATLHAAMRLGSARVFNRYFVDSFNQQVSGPARAVRVLAEAGWATPSVRLSLSASGAIERIYYPPAEEHPRYVLMLSQRNHLIWPGEDTVLPEHDAFEAMVGRTQRHLGRLAIDFACIPFVAHGGRFYPFGMDQTPPDDISERAVATVLAEALL